MDEEVGPVHENVRQAQRADAGIGNPHSSDGFETSKGRGVMHRADESDDVDEYDPAPGGGEGPPTDEAQAERARIIIEAWRKRIEEHRQVSRIPHSLLRTGCAKTNNLISMQGGSARSLT